MIVEMKNIRKYYEIPGISGNCEVLHDINLVIKSGDSVAVTGPSGSGKTTLLNIIGTLDKPSSGSVSFKGEDVSGFDNKKLVEIRNSHIGFIFQLHHLLPQLNLLENVLLPVIPQKKSINAGKAPERAKALLDSVGLSDKIYQRPGQLSGGECQRATVVRALINQPELILADEPTGSLDMESAHHLGDLLSDLNKKHNVALILVTHSIDLANKMNTVYNLKNGKLSLSGDKII